MSNKKDRAFTVRFTEEQFHHIAEQADRAMMSPSNYIRAAAMRGKVNVILDGKVVARELKAIGNNLNQLTVLANMGQINAVYLEQVHEDMNKLYERFFALADKVDKSITLADYTAIWLREIAPTKLAKSTLARDKQDIDRFMPYLGGYKLTDLKPEHFRNLYAELRKQKNSVTGKPLSECTVEGVHACLCGILSDAMEGGFLSHNPAWRTYKYTGKKKKKQNVADEETTQKLIAALEEESIKYETYFKLIIATGMRRGECCGLKWCDVNFREKSIHICRNVVKITGEDIIVKEPKTASGERYVYFSAEMASLLKEYRKFCQQETETVDERELSADDYIFRRHGMELPMTPSSFTWRFKLILKKHGLPENLNVHSLRHTAASLMIAGGADVATVSGLLGHSQVSTTLDIYTHAFDDKKKAASAVLQESLDI